MNKETGRRLPKSIIIVGLLVGLILVGIGCMLFAKNNKNPGDDKHTNPIFAEIALKNLAVGIRTYSAMTGGGGNAMFTGDPSKIKEYVMQDAFQALSGANQIPFHGYVFELMENPIGDEFNTNFKFVARPSIGFVGQAFQIDKFEQITPLN